MAMALKSILYALLALSARGVAACNDQHDPLEATCRSLRETKTNGIDHGLSGDSKGKGGIAEGEGFFIINDKNWASEEQFVSGGGRCQTAPMSDKARAQHAADLKNFRAQADDDDQLRRRLQTTITVYVNWVVISNTAGVGNLARRQINSQVNILNAAFAPQFRFQVLNVQRIVSNKLFTCTNYTEYEMSSTYRTNNPAVLNLFTCYPPGFLGWSRFPSGGIAGSVWDLAVVAHNTLPGGNLGPYSYGHVSVVAENRRI
jgi:hypothetical protein